MRELDQRGRGALSSTTSGRDASSRFIATSGLALAVLLLPGVKATTALSALDGVLAGLKPDTPLVLAVQMLQDNGLTGAAVLDDAGQPIGALSDEACLRLLVHDVYDRAEASTVADAMTTPPTFVHVDTPLPVVAERMVAAETSCLLVLNDQEILVGQITRERLLAAMMALVQDDAHDGRFVTERDNPAQEGSMASWTKRRTSVRDTVGTTSNEVFRKAFESGAPDEGGGQQEDDPYPGHRRSPPSPSEKA